MGSNHCSIGNRLRNKYLFFGLAALVMSLSGCNVFAPYLSQPSWDGTYASAEDALNTAQNQLSSRIASEEAVSTAANTGTFLGLGAAGVGAVFGASSKIILASVTTGAGSAAFGGLYSSSTQAAIYNNGLDAINCVGDAVANINAANASIRTALADLDAAQNALTSYGSVPAMNNKQVLLSEADSARISANSFLDSENTIAAPQLIHAVRSVIAVTNSQLRAALPDAAAFARAGSSLQTAIISGISVGGPSPRASFVVSSDQIEVALESRLLNAIHEVDGVTSRVIQSPVIPCTVANVMPVAPISVVLPSGVSEIDVGTDSTATYQISGGTYPYTSISWSPAAPPCLTVVIISPNTLQISPNSGGTCTVGQTFNFDIYDIAGQHLPKMMVLKITPS